MSNCQERGCHVVSSWIGATRRVTVSLVGALLFGGSGAAVADHDPRVNVEISVPGIYTRFSTGPQWGYRYYEHEHWRQGPVYVPGYWVYNPPYRYWRGGNRYYYDRYEHRAEDRPRHHHKRHHDNRRGNRHDYDD